MALNGNWKVFNRAGRNMHYHQVSSGRRLGQNCEKPHPVYCVRCWGDSKAGGDSKSKMKRKPFSQENWMVYKQVWVGDEGVWD